MTDRRAPPARLLLVDDHELFRAGLGALLSANPDVEIVGEASNGVEALAAIERLTPSLAIIDISLPGINGLELAERLARSHPWLRVMILSMHTGEPYVRRARCAGARAYLPKDAAPQELESAIRAVLAGATHFCPTITRAARAAPASGVAAASGGATPEPMLPGGSFAPVAPAETGARLDALTPRQREILTMVAQGQSTKQIARLLDLSVKTIDTHRAQISRRLAIRDLAGLVRFAIRHGLVRLDA